MLEDGDAEEVVDDAYDSSYEGWDDGKKATK